MKKTFLLAPLLISVVAALTLYAAAQQQTQAGVRLITGAAEALGGRERILAVKTIVLEGYGEAAYMNGGGNISASPDAPSDRSPRSELSPAGGAQLVRPRYDFDPTLPPLERLPYISPPYSSC